MNPPKEWLHKEQLTADKLNAEIRDRFEYHRNGRFLVPPDHRLNTERTPGVLTVATTTPLPLAVNDSRFAGDFIASGVDILLLPQLHTQINAAGQVGYFDILIDDNLYIYTQAPEPSTWDALWRYQTASINQSYLISTPYLWRNVEPGYHTWKLVYWTNSASYLLVTNDAYVPCFVAFLEI